MLKKAAVGGRRNGEEGRRPWRAGGAMEREKDGRPCLGAMEMPAGGLTDAVGRRSAVAALWCFFFVEKLQ
jgi:hypothetical protein